MKTFELASICIITFGIFFGGAVLASHSIYRADVRSCVSEGGSEADCEFKFK